MNTNFSMKEETYETRGLMQWVRVSIMLIWVSRSGRCNKHACILRDNIEGNALKPRGKPYRSWHRIWRPHFLLLPLLESLLEYNIVRTDQRPEHRKYSRVKRESSRLRI